MIYFVQPKDGGQIKIGTTARLSTRLSQLCCEFNVELRVLAVTNGSHSEETAIHHRFAHLRKSGEWFEPGNDLIGFIVNDARPWDGKDEAAPFEVTKVAADVMRMARIAAALEDKPLAELLSEILRPILVKKLVAHGVDPESHAKKKKPD